ncbi:MAG: C40 family peptidase [Prevotellaceae bacterium]|jgi:LysM repeat protein|nr:C40 family peptidase [Prevotellaceae bacterium]
MLRFSWIFLLFLCSSIFAQTEFSAVPHLNSIEEMLSFAVKQQRKPYKGGAEGPNAFDCSGFTRYCYKQLGIELKRSSQDQAKDGEKVRKRKLKEGDLVFFKGNSGRRINHVGIVYRKKGGKEFEFIHASTSSGIIIENSEVEYFKDRYVTARRVTTDREIRKIIKAIEKENKDLAKQRKEEAKQQEKLAKQEAKRKKETEKEQKNKQEETTETVSTPANSSEENNLYIVKKGDTLYNISKRFDCTVEDLQRWNRLKGNDISLGQELIVK